MLLRCIPAGNNNFLPDQDRNPTVHRGKHYPRSSDHPKPDGGKPTDCWPRRLDSLQDQKPLLVTHTPMKNPSSSAFILTAQMVEMSR